MRNTERLIYKLKTTDKIANKRLAKNISIVDNSNTFSVNKEGKRMYKNEKKAYKVLLKMFPKELRERIKWLDVSINAVIDYIERRSGWMYITDEFMYRDNFQNMHDPEFRSFDTYRVRRNEDGFYVDENNSGPNYIKDKERIFYRKYSSKLNALHSFIEEKKRLIQQSIYATEDPNLAYYLAIYLGYIEDDTRKIIK